MVPGQAQGMGEDSSQVLVGGVVLDCSGSLLKPGPEQRARGSLWKKAVIQGLILDSSCASSVAGHPKATWPGRKPVWRADSA